MLIETSRVRGQVTKRVTCEHCRCAYRYDVARAARATSAAPLLMLLLAAPLLLVALRLPFTTLRIASRMGAGRGGRGSGGGGEMDAAANRRLRKELDRAVEPVACPECGWYQKDMVGEIRGRAMPWVDWVALGVVATAELAALAVWRGNLWGQLSPHLWSGADPVTSWLAITGVAIASGGAVLAARWLSSLRLDPNHGHPAPRPPFPGAPTATTEAAWVAEITAATARLSANIGRRAPSASARRS